MTPIDPHPPLSSFPPVLFTAVVALELVSVLLPGWRRRVAPAIGVNLVLACLTTAVAFFSGYRAAGIEQDLEQLQSLVDVHHQTGRLLLFAVVPCAALYYFKLVAQYSKRVIALLYYGALTLCFALAVYTALLGGELVFEHGIGTKRQQEASNGAYQ